MAEANVQPWQNAEWIDHTQCILDSWEHWIGNPLITRVKPDVDAEHLFKAPFVVVAHGTEEDPLLSFGNQVALDLWEMPLSRFLGTPSRKTAEPVHRTERSELLRRTSEDGFIDDYSGIRIASTGRRFRIHQATVWNLIDATGARAGQAAMFSKWTRLE